MTHSLLLTTLHYRPVQGKFFSTIALSSDRVRKQTNYHKIVAPWTFEYLHFTYQIQKCDLKMALSHQNEMKYVPILYSS